MIRYPEGKRILIAIFLVSFCGLLYELLIATFASYVLGDSVSQFSLTIGLFIGAMGVGSYFSKFFVKNLLPSFVFIQFLLGLIGGLSIVSLVTLMKWTLLIGPLIYSYLIIIGFLIGLELPLLTRMLESGSSLKDLLSHALSLDNIGALVASLIFPIFLIPTLGMFKVALLAGVLNISIGIYLAQAAKQPVRRGLSFVGVLLVLGLLSMQLFMKKYENDLQADFYVDPVVYSKQSSYQKVVLTRFNKTLRLYLNGQIQFSADDEHRYHEALVHSAFRYVGNPRRILVLGGGDGLAVREILKYKSVQQVHLVDLDKEVTVLGKTHKQLSQLNQHSLWNKKVKVFHEDAFKFLKDSRLNFDIILIDLPDPNNLSLAKLYSREFYKLASQHLSSKGVLITQATSPHVAQKTFWSVHQTVATLGFPTKAIHLNVPSFGEWGFVLLGKTSFVKLNEAPSGLKYFSDDVYKSMETFPEDLKSEKSLSVVSTLLNPRIYSLYQKEVRDSGFM